MPRMGPRIVAEAARVIGQIDTAALEELTVRLLQRIAPGGVDTWLSPFGRETVWGWMNSTIVSAVKSDNPRIRLGTAGGAG